MWIGRALKNRFVLVSELGRGGMGVVYMALDRRRETIPGVDPYVAVKLLREEFVNRPDALRVLQREFFSAQSLAHPNIVNVYHFDADGGCFFMTMELLRGESLRNRFRRDASAVPLDKASDLIRAMAAGLTHAHEHDIVHCDFKPANVFLCEDGEVRILDFGIAKASRTDAFDGGFMAATPGYATREILEGGSVDPRDDMYAFACVCYQLLTGSHPFEGCSAVEAAENGMVPKPIRGLTRSQWHAFEKALAFKRNNRTGSIRKFLKGLGIDQPKPPSRTALVGIAAFVVGAFAASLFGPRLLSGPGSEETSPETVLDTSAGIGVPEPAVSVAEPVSTSRVTDSVTVVQDRPAESAESAESAEAGETGEAVRTTAASRTRVPEAGADGPVEFGLVADRYTVSEGFAALPLTLRRNGGVDDEATVAWRTSDGSATAGSDYAGFDWTVETFGPGEMNRSIYVPIISDSIAEPSEVFYVELRAGGAGEIAGVGRASVTILDDD